MLKIHGVALLCLTLSTLLACSDPEETDGGVLPKKDSGAPPGDSGVDSGTGFDAQPMDVGTNDLGGNPDAVGTDGLVQDGAEADADLLDAGPSTDADLDASSGDGADGNVGDTGDPDAQPGDAQPGDAQPGDGQPGDTTPGDGGTGAGNCASPQVAHLGTNNGDTSNTASIDEGSCVGFGQNEEVWTFTATSSGTLHIVLDSAVDLGVYVRTTCTDSQSENGYCTDSGSAGDTETLDVPVTSGQTVFIIVDGYDDTPPNLGPYTLQLSIVPDACSTALTAALGPQTGDTTGKPNGYAGSCQGDVAGEEIWIYTPTLSGVLTIEVSSNVDPVLYARTTCSDGNSEILCIDGGGSGEGEILTITVTNASPVFIFVDGYNGDEGPYTLTLSI